MHFMVISANFQGQKPNWSIFCLGKDKAFLSPEL